MSICAESRTRRTAVEFLQAQHLVAPFQLSAPGSVPMIIGGGNVEGNWLERDPSAQPHVVAVDTAPMERHAALRPDVDSFFCELLALGRSEHPWSLIPAVLERLRSVTQATDAHVEMRRAGCPTLIAQTCASKLMRLAVERTISERALLSLRSAADSESLHTAPIVANDAVGAVILTRPASMTGFSVVETQRLRAVADQLSAIAERISSAPRTLADDIQALKVRRVREAMNRNGGNVSAVARELRVGRKLVYAIIKDRAALKSRHELYPEETLSSPPHMIVSGANNFTSES